MIDEKHLLYTRGSGESQARQVVDEVRVYPMNAPRLFPLWVIGLSIYRREVTCLYDAILTKYLPFHNLIYTLVLYNRFCVIDLHRSFRVYRGANRKSGNQEPAR
jgi:hypothetical protein